MGINSINHNRNKYFFLDLCKCSFNIIRKKESDINLQILRMWSDFIIYSNINTFWLQRKQKPNQTKHHHVHYILHKIPRSTNSIKHEKSRRNVSAALDRSEVNKPLRYSFRTKEIKKKKKQHGNCPGAGKLSKNKRQSKTEKSEALWKCSKSPLSIKQELDVRVNCIY